MYLFIVGGMLGRLCFSILILQTLCTFKAQIEPRQASPTGDNTDTGNVELRNNFNEISDPLVKVDFEIGRAGYFTSEEMVARGKNVINCIGDKVDRANIYWSKNGVRVDAEFSEEETESTVQSSYIFVNTDEAIYHCNGLYVYMIKNQEPRPAQNASMWKNSKIRCIDKIRNEETNILEKMTNGRKTAVEFYEIRDYSLKKQSFYPVKERTVTSDMTITCNNTDEFSFFAETRPETNLEFTDKTVICTSTDNQARCALTIFFGSKIVATGVSPRLEHNYKKINIQQVRCTSECTIGNDFVTAAPLTLEINRTLYICIILVIILIIIILIIIILCVLWHKFGFKEKYGYQINMRLKKNFAVDTNKLSSYRLSGVQAQVPIEVDGDDEPDVKEFRDMDDGSLDDSFVDPNFARTNNKLDMRSKDDISSSGTSNQRPFLRI
ncbi:hypothetical protein ACHWQZ_G017433 [Mnemiopsis leidyi]